MSYSFDELLSVVEESNVPYGNTILKFLIDAQLPKKLCDLLNQKGCVSIHTLDLLNKNATTDKAIKELASSDGLILITKDDDFLRSFMIEKKPSKLILVKTGNIDNRSLLEIFDKGFTAIASLARHHPLIEITRQEIIVHD